MSQVTAPKGNSLKAKRAHAVLSALFCHALRRAELCALKVTDSLICPWSDECGVRGTR